MHNFKYLINSFIFFVSFSFYLYINYILKFNNDYFQYRDSVYSLESFISISSKIVFIIVIIVSFLIYPIINLIINYKVRKRIFDEEIHFKFYIKLKMYFWSIINGLFQGWLVGEKFIPYLLLYDKTSQNSLLLTLISLFSIISFLLCIEFQYNKFILTNKSLYIFSCLSIVDICIKNIVGIKSTGYGKIEIKYCNDKTKFLYIVVDEKMIKKIIQNIKEKKYE